jgi:hypothetical protein
MKSSNLKRFSKKHLEQLLKIQAEIFWSALTIGMDVTV